MGNATQDEIDIGSISDLELGWLAGILEGEGYFHYHGSQIIDLKMTDEDVMIKVKAILDRILGQEVPLDYIIEKHPNKNNIYRIYLSGAKARAAMRLLVPIMGYRRRAQIWRALNGYKHTKLKISLKDLGLLPDKIKED